MFKKVSLFAALSLAVLATASCNSAPSPAATDQVTMSRAEYDQMRAKLASTAPAATATETPAQKTGAPAAQVAEVANVSERSQTGAAINPSPASKPEKRVARATPKTQFPVDSDHEDYWDENPIQVAYRAEQDIADGDSFDH